MRIPYKNSVTFAGFVGNDVELRSMGSGDPVCSIRIASKHSWKDAKEGWKESTEWATAVFYRQDATDVAAAVKKGDFIHVEGRKFTREWEDTAKVKRRSEEIIVANWHKVDLAAVGQRQQAETSSTAGEKGDGSKAEKKPVHRSNARTQRPKAADYDYTR